VGTEAFDAALPGGGDPRKEAFRDPSRPMPWKRLILTAIAKGVTRMTQPLETVAEKLNRIGDRFERLGNYDKACEAWAKAAKASALAQTRGARTTGQNGVNPDGSPSDGRGGGPTSFVEAMTQLEDAHEAQQDEVSDEAQREELLNEDDDE
jgi:hypothetical protein